MKKLFTFTAAFVLTCAPVYADWKWTKIHDDENSTVYIDQTKLRGTKTKRVWERWELKTPMSGISSMLFLREIDCDESKIRFLETESYGSANLSGDVKVKLTTPGSWDYLRPNSWFNAMFELICKKAP
jgi:hypothetical protein